MIREQIFGLRGNGSELYFGVERPVLSSRGWSDQDVGEGAVWRVRVAVTRFGRRRRGRLSEVNRDGVQKQV